MAVRFNCEPLLALSDVMAVGYKDEGAIEQKARSKRQRRVRQSQLVERRLSRSEQVEIVV